MKRDALKTELRVWDLPTRCFHWALALCIGAALLTGWFGDDGIMVWHMRFGLAAAALLVFRGIWGLIGGRWSRFASFLFTPAALWRHLRGKPRADERFEAGHSPLGALAVWAMLLVLSAQVGSGLVADDEVAFSGPLVRWVSERVSKLGTHWHAELGPWLIAALIALHLGAIAVYQWRGRRLVSAMWHGDKQLPPGIPASRDTAGSRLLALLLFAACAAAAIALARLG
jgi:cytochrome b